MPVDFIGQEIRLGDFVAFAKPGSSTIVLGVIMRLSKQIAIMSHEGHPEQSRQFHAQLIKIHPRTIQTYIPREKLEVGGCYFCNARNFVKGTWNGTDFDYKRIKFGRTFMDTELHYDEGVPHGTVKPFMKASVI